LKERKPDRTGPRPEHQGDRGAILFTGFPGFIGSRLLPRVLALKPGLRAECLVQEKFLETAREAAAAIEKKHPHTRGRIALGVGDITARGLGVGASRATALQKELVEAYHLAAVYDLAVSRDVGRRINVEGTKNVLEFLGPAPRFDRLHYVSTAYVSGTVRGTFRETDLDVGQGFKNHYEETKFQAEVEVARSDVPRTIYRPGIVVGDSMTGETGKFDGPYFVLRVMERLPNPGIFFRLGSGDATVNVVPVDFVIEALARLSAAPGSYGKTYHITDPHPLSVHEIARLFAEALERRFAYLPMPMVAVKAMFTPTAVQNLFGIPRQALDYFDDHARHDATQATTDLAAVGVACPRLRDYLPRLVAFYREQRDRVRREAMV